MLWESCSDSKENQDETGSGSNKNLHPNVTPVLLPAQSVTSTHHERVPVVVPDVQELKEQFQIQQNMLTQLKETIKENESELNSKGKKVEAYANRLAQIRARTKRSDNKTNAVPRKPGTSPVKTLSRKSSKENLAKDNDSPVKNKSPQSNVKLSPKAKYIELKKKLQESKIKFEERTGKEVSETKRIESIVEHLKMQLEERDVTIQELQKIAEQPPLPSVKLDTSSRKSRSKSEGKPIASKSTQTTCYEPNDESIEIMSLQNRIYELEESLKEKESVIDARTQAVTLLSQDLSIKGKNTLECLEETRQEMRSMQNNFIIIENQLKKELVEKDEKLISTEEKLEECERVIAELTGKNATLVERLTDMEKKFADSESGKKLTHESVTHVENDDIIAELNNKINILNKELSDSNVSMIKMKLGYKHKIKNLNNIIENLTEFQTTGDKAKIVQLQTLVDDFEVVKESLQNKIAELEEEKASESKLKEVISQLEARIKEQATEIESQLQTIANIEKEKFDMSQSAQDQNILIENLYAKIQNLESEMSEKDFRIKQLEDELKIKIDGLDGGEKRELEECRITKELNNVQVEEQIEMLIREKQQLLDKLKSLSGVSSTESFTFETVEHADFEGQSESKPPIVESILCRATENEGSFEAENQDLRLQRIIDEQQTTINDLQNVYKNEREKTLEYQRKLEKLETDFKSLEHANNQLKPEVSDEGEASKTSKSNANVKNKIKKIQAELLESRKTIQLQNEKLEELNMKLEEKEQLIKDYIEKIELFEKDDWGRENDWKATQDEFEHMRELQKKCLSLENSLIELTEDCERLRKENIEVVHLLSEEKVKRKKLMEKFQVQDYGSLMSVEANEPKPDLLDESGVASPEEESFVKVLEGRFQKLVEAEESLESRLRALELQQNHQSESNHIEEIKNLESTIKDLQEKLEWSNIVLTSKETEIFKLQSSCEDSEKTIEDLQRDIKEAREKLTESTGKLNEIQTALESKHKELSELSVNNTSLQERVRAECERAVSLESQLRCHEQTIKDLQIDGDRREKAFLEVQSSLNEKNSEINKLKKGLKKLDRDLTSTYEERLGNMGKSMRDTEEKYNELLSQKKESDESRQALQSMNENLQTQIKQLTAKEEEFLFEIEDRERIIRELSARINELLMKESNEGSDDIQLKMKKLAATLKKKVQAEKNLSQQVKEQEEMLAEKENLLKKLANDFEDVNEKWAREKSEKEQFKTELDTVVLAKSAIETENAELKEKSKLMENDYNSKLQKSEYKIQQMEAQLQKMYENSERLRLKQEQDKELMAKMESELTSSSTEIKKDNEELRLMLGEICQKYEEKKFEVDELCRDKSQVEEKLIQVRAEMEPLKKDNTCKEAKIQEQLAVIESLETDLSQTRDHLRRSEEKLSLLEEQRSALESKTEEMLKRIEEDSKNVALMDDMSNQIQVLTESETNLRSAVKSLDDRNKELELEIKEITADKAALEKELTEFRQKLSNAHGELERFREIDGEKSAVVELLSAESERLKCVKMESKQKSMDIEKLQKDIELLEADLKENVENSKSVEKLMNHKIEELLQENATLSEKLKDLSEAKEKKEDAKTVSRKKSVTFKADETSYIQDLKSKIQEYSEEIRKYEEEVANLKTELLRERLRNQVDEVVLEAKEKVESLKSTPEKTQPKFDASVFFGKDPAPEESPFFDQQVDGLGAPNPEQNVDYDSLMWDDGWGTDGHLEEQYFSTQVVAPNQEKCDLLEKELKIVEEDKKKIEEEYQQLQAKYAKVVKKMKEQKAACDKLQSEVNRLKNDAGFGGLDGAIVDELKSQIATYEQREKELVKSLESAKAEKEGLLKRIEILNAGHEKLVEMKERQDEIHRWETKNRELLDEIAELRNELRNKEKEMSVDENELVRELKNKIEGLEWENCELKETLEEKQEMLELRNEAANEGKEDKLAKEVEELNEAKQDLEKRLAEEERKSGEIILDLEQKVSALAAENETLQEILNEMKKSQKSKPVEPVVPSTSTAETETKVFDYFKSAPVSDVFSSIAVAPVYKEPVVEPVIESKVAVQVSASSNQLERELENLRQENGLLQQQLSEAQSVIESVKTERHEVTEKYRKEYENALSFHLEEKNNALQKVYELEQALAVKVEELNNLSTRMKDLDQVVALKIEDLHAVNKQRQELEQALGMKSEESNNYIMRINELQQTLVSKAEELEKAKTIQSELESALQAKGSEVNRAVEAVQMLEEKLRVREEEGYKILTEMAAKVEEINRLSFRTKELEEECSRKSASLENIQKVNDELLRNVEHSTPEIETLTRMLTAERSTVEELRGSLNEKEEVLRTHAEEIKSLRDKLNESEEKLKKATQEYEKLRTLSEEYCEAKEKLEDLVSNLRTELQTVNLELELSREELEKLRRAKEDEIAELEVKVEAAAKFESEMKALREEMRAKAEDYEKRLSEKESAHNEETMMIQKASRAMEAHIETLKSELKEKENDIFELSQTLDEEQKQLGEMRALLEAKDAEIADLKHALNGFEEEIKSFRNFEKQVKELRLAQMGSNVSVTAQGDPDFTNWTEHELTELNTRLQSDLDTALYMLHQRDIRCDELTFELMQLLEERDTLQLRLSTVIRINEELRSLTSNDSISHMHYAGQESKDVADQSNDRQLEKVARVPEEDLQQLALKISELHSVGYIKDKTIQDETARRHRDQMTLLGRVSNTNLGRESQSSTSVTNWIRTGKAPKVMHI